MPYARISMMEFNSPLDMETAEEDYQRIREETFPGIQMTINVRTATVSGLVRSLSRPRDCSSQSRRQEEGR